jgi:hypothetical protein
MRKILKYGLLLLAISLIGIWIFVYFRHFFVQLPRVNIILNEIAERPSLLAGIAILGIFLTIFIEIIIPLTKGIYSHLRREKIDLPTIDEVLKEEKIKDTSFDKFLKERKAPNWIDFEKGYITKRREVDVVVAKLEKNKVHLVIGPPSSGKSVIIKNIGYELRKKKYDVFVKELQLTTEELDIKDIVEEISKIKKKKTLLIIDDVHLGLTEDNKLKCNKLLRQIGPEPKIKILLSGRDVIEEKIGPHTTTPLEILMQDEKTCTKINATDAVEDILINFENKSNIKIKEEHRGELRKRYGHDLWVLSLALGLYDPKCSIPTEKELLKKIKELLTVDEYKWIHADDIILPISAFYCYEAPVAMRTLTKTLLLNEENIRELIHFGEIRENNRMLSLHHSSRAKLYLETFKEYKELGENVKETIQKKFGDWYIGLFHLYFRSKPKVCVGLLSRLSKEYKEGIIEDDIVSELMRNDGTKNAIFEKISESIMARNVNNFQHIIGRISNKTFSNEFLEYFSEEDLLEFLNNSKLNQIGYFLGPRGYYSINVQNAYRRFFKGYLIGKMNCATLDEIRVFIRGLSQVKFRKDVFIGTKLALNAIGKLTEVDKLSQKLEDAPLETIRHLIKNINDVNGNPKFILDGLKPPFNLIQKLGESSLNDINMLILSIDRANITSNEPESNSRFIIDQIKQMDQNKLIQKMKKNTLQYINHFIVNIKNNDVESSNYIFELIKQLDLTEKLKESGLRDLGNFALNISDDRDLSDRYSRLFDDFDLAENLDQINHFLWSIFQMNFDIPKTFTDIKIRNALINRLNEDNEDIGERLRLIGIFEYANCPLLGDGDKIAKIKIVTPKVKEWFKEYLDPSHPNLFRIALALKGFRTIDEKNALSFVRSYVTLKEIDDCLKRSEIKNRKSEQLIENLLSWLNGLEME